ncbi:biotin carboxylase [Moritella sp. 5]|nr:biotin carboxylase [Moritella sp. 5]
MFNQVIIFLSSRQISQVDFNDPSLIDAELVLIASDNEVLSLSRNVKEQFSNIITVPVIYDDGVIYEYDESIVKESIAIWDNYKLSIISFDEGCVELVHSLRTIFNLSKEVNSDMSRFRDKIIMKQRLDEKNIRVPSFIEKVEITILFEDITKKVGLPFVLKPRRSAGSNNVFIINSSSEFENVKLKLGHALTDYEIESYIDGSLFHCDIGIWKGSAIFSECTEYYKPTLAFQSGEPLGGRFMESSLPLRNELIAFTWQALQALDATDGVYHSEIFVCNGELIFLEVGARPPGMLVTTMYQQATGVNLLNLDIRIQQGIPPVKQYTTRQNEAFYLVYPRGIGLVKEINYPSVNTDVCTEFKSTVKIGDEHVGCQSNLDHCAYITCSGEKNALSLAYKQMVQFSPIVYKSCN